MTDDDKGAKRAERLRLSKRGSCSPEEHERRAAAYLLARSCGYPMSAMARKLGLDARRFYEWAWRHFPEHYVNSGSARRKTVRDPALAPPTTLRRCLTCDGPFPSTGPGNRMCGTCRSRAHDTYSPYEPNPGGHTGRRVRASRS